MSRSDGCKDCAQRLVTPIPEAHVRRAQRVLAMVHELHKVGFQQLRIAPYFHANGAWRCSIVPRSVTLRDHGAIVADEHSLPVVVYSGAQGNEYFNWTDARSDSARKLAAKFLTRFAEVADAARGRDWAYVGWYAEMLGHSEDGALPWVFGDYEEPLSDGIYTIGDIVLPMPPPGDIVTPRGHGDRRVK